MELKDRSRIAVQGSCVTRDPYNLMTNDVILASYYARSSIISLMADPVNLGINFEAMDAPSFEKRCIQADLDKSWFEKLSVKSDLVVMDFIDERFGLGMLGDQTFTMSTPLRRLLDRNGASLGDVIFVPPLSPKYESMLRQHLPAFCERLAQIPKLLINDAAWTVIKEDGSKFPQKEQENAVKSNALLEIIFEEIAKRTSASFTGFSPQKLVAKVGHRWGDAPFHYSDETEKMIAEKLTQAARTAKAL